VKPYLRYPASIISEVQILLFRTAYFQLRVYTQHIRTRQTPRSVDRTADISRTNTIIQKNITPVLEFFPAYVVAWNVNCNSRLNS